jgi:hypothetical protein
MSERRSDGDRMKATADPFAAIGKVQHQAVEQATAIFGRMLRVFDERRADDPLATSDDGEPDASFAQLRAAVSRTVDLYVELFQRTFESYAEMIETTLRRRGVSVTGSTDARGDDLVLDRVDDEAAVHGTLFVHNFSGATAGPLRVRLSDLSAHDGSTISRSEVDVEPASLDTVADGTTARVDIRIDVTGARAGTYHGHAFAGEGVLPVRVVVPERRRDDCD